jgi:hypothetical protein
VLLELWTVPGNVVRDWWSLLGVLFGTAAGRDAHGSLVSVPYRSRGEDARSWARRALAIASVSLAPNTIVVGMADDRVLVHRLAGQELNAITSRLRGGT